MDCIFGSAKKCKTQSSYYVNSCQEINYYMWAMPKGDFCVEAEGCVGYLRRRQANPVACSLLCPLRHVFAMYLFLYLWGGLNFPYELTGLE